MKRIFALALAVISLATVSCTKPSLPTPQLSSTVDELVIESYSSKIAFSLNWDMQGGTVQPSRTYIQFASNKEFLSPYVVSSSEQSYLVTFRDMKSMHETFGVTDDYTLYVRLLVDGEGASSVYSNKIRMKVTLP